MDFSLRARPRIGQLSNIYGCCQSWLRCSAPASNCRIKERASCISRKFLWKMENGVGGDVTSTQIYWKSVSLVARFGMYVSFLNSNIFPSTRCILKSVSCAAKMRTDWQPDRRETNKLTSAYKTIINLLPSSLCSESNHTIASTIFKTKTVNSSKRARTCKEESRVRFELTVTDIQMRTDTSSPSLEYTHFYLRYCLLRTFQ